MSSPRARRAAGPCEAGRFYPALQLCDALAGGGAGGQAQVFKQNGALVEQLNGALGQLVAGLQPLGKDGNGIGGAHGLAAEKAGVGAEAHAIERVVGQQVGGGEWGHKKQ